jgi:predicted metal-binding protein/predicted O-methyltransferase YrrM
MNNSRTWMHPDPQYVGPQYLEDLATGYWFSEALFAAVEADIFSLLDRGGKSAAEIALKRGFSDAVTERFLHALCAMGLLYNHGKLYFNTTISGEYLVAGKPNCQRESILWRKRLIGPWSGLTACLEKGGRVGSLQEQDALCLAKKRREYIKAMDCVAKAKVKEVLPLFTGLTLTGAVLDVGAGSGAITAGFLERFPHLKATLVDIPEVLEIAGEFLAGSVLHDRISFCAFNILEPWPPALGNFDLVILSNIIHAYSEKELPQILASAVECLSEKGLVIIHDFFLEHCPSKAALFDMNMFINTCNGRVFSQKDIASALSGFGLHVLAPLPLKSDTALILASPDQEVLDSLDVGPKQRVAATVRGMGFTAVSLITTDAIHVADWTELRCGFGCERYGQRRCPPNIPSPEQTRRLLVDYKYALLLEGAPPTKNFQLEVVKAEREAFLAGFYKALAFWAGPCTLCEECPSEGKCLNPRDSRPSMEGVGIDVFETVKRAGFRLRTLKSAGDYIKYFALILLE